MIDDLNLVQTEKNLFKYIYNSKFFKQEQEHILSRKWSQTPRKNELNDTRDTSRQSNTQTHAQTWVHKRHGMLPVLELSEESNYSVLLRFVKDLRHPGSYCRQLLV